MKQKALLNIKVTVTAKEHPIDRHDTLNPPEKQVHDSLIRFPGGAAGQQMSSGDLELSRPELLGEGLTFLGSASHPPQLIQQHLLLTGPTGVRTSL